MAGGKKKSAKASKISEMQRARQLKLRADHEEESRRQKMQLIALYMKVSYRLFYLINEMLI